MNSTPSFWGSRLCPIPGIPFLLKVIQFRVGRNYEMIVEESMKPDVVSKRILNRLPLYLTYLKSLPDSAENISATVIAKALDIGEVTVRKDLARISHTGRRRTGRNRAHLIREIEEYLDCTANSGAIIVGTGKLGQALLDYDGFEKAIPRITRGNARCVPRFATGSTAFLSLIGI